jgi:hypothetical protein
LPNLTKVILTKLNLTQTYPDELATKKEDIFEEYDRAIQENLLTLPFARFEALKLNLFNLINYSLLNTVEAA